jgi:hypothetical protein
MLCKYSDAVRGGPATASLPGSHPIRKGPIQSFVMIGIDPCSGATPVLTLRISWIIQSSIELLWITSRLDQFHCSKVSVEGQTAV